jgi:hypothetical protein
MTMESFIGDYFLGCLWLAGMHAVALRRFARGRGTLLFASTPLAVATVTTGLALALGPGTEAAAFVVLVLAALCCLVAGGISLLGVLLCGDAELRRHLAISTLMLGGPVLLFPLTIVFDAL